MPVPATMATRCERLRTTHRNRLVEAPSCFGSKVAKVFQPAQELNLMVTELPHQGRPLVLQQVPALSDEGGTPAALQQLSSGGDKGVHHTSRVCFLRLPPILAVSWAAGAGRPSAKFPTCWLPTSRNVGPVCPRVGQRRRW